MGSTLGSIINRVFLAAVTSTVVLLLGVFLAWIFREEQLAKQKALASARSILDAQIPAIAEALDRNSTDAVQMRLSLLFATHREHDFAGIVLNRDKQMLASTNFDLADLSHLTAQVDPIEVASGSRVYVGRNISVGLEDIGVAVFSIAVDQGFTSSISYVFLIGFCVLVLSYGLTLGFIQRSLKHHVLKPMHALVEALPEARGFISGNVATNPLAKLDPTQASEIHFLQDTLREQIETIRNSISDISRLNAEKSYHEAIATLGKQVAHDIRAPMSAIGAVMTATDLPEEKKALLKQAIDRVQGIANNLLKLGRSGAVEARFNEAFCIVKVVSSVVEERKVDIAAKGNVKIATRYLIGPNEVFLKIDRYRLMNVISNLIQNAHEAIGASHGTVSIVLTMLSSEVQIEIIDDGPGIPPDILSKLGTKGSSFGKIDGNGLGLFDAKQFISGAGGRLDITSKVGVGTRVTLILPIRA